MYALVLICISPTISGVEQFRIHVSRLRNVCLNLNHFICFEFFVFFLAFVFVVVLFAFLIYYVN